MAKRERDALGERRRRAEAVDEVMAYFEALPDAGTPLTDEERDESEAAWAEYLRGDFVVDPLTART